MRLSFPELLVKESSLISHYGNLQKLVTVKIGKRRKLWKESLK